MTSTNYENKNSTVKLPLRKKKPANTDVETGVQTLIAPSLRVTKLGSILWLKTSLTMNVELATTTMPK